MNLRPSPSMPNSLTEGKRVPKLHSTSEKIRKFISRQGLRAGESLPTEMELVEMTGVSRWIVREALRQLDTLGIVKTQRGRRTIVGSDADKMQYFVSVVMTSFELSQPDLECLHDLRVLIEAFCASRIIERATNVDIRELERLCDEIEKCGHNIEKRISLVLDFHTRMVEIVGNEFGVQAMQMLRRPLLLGMMSCEETEKDRDLLLQRSILQAINNRNKKRLCALIQEHL